MSEQVLFFSSSIDAPTTNRVMASMERRGYDVVSYEADKVALGEISLTTTISTTAGVQITYAGQAFCPQEFAAAWYRRPGLFGPVDIATDHAARESVDLERRASQQIIEDLVPSARWLNSPEALRRQNPSRKLGQLCLAQQIGFQIPTTVVGNEWEAIAATLDSEIIYKSFWGQRIGTDGRFAVFTTPLQNTGSDTLSAAGLPFPGIWQDNIPKSREWRVTVVGDEIFAAVLRHHNDQTKDDWRRHTVTGDLVWQRGNLPDTAAANCHAYVTRAGLKTGMIDLVESPDGELTFLECNPNGQYAGFERELGFPISEAIAGELAHIARECAG